MKKINIAVIGCGYLGRFHAEKYSQIKDVNLKWLVDINEESVQQLSKSLNASYSTDYKKIVNDIDAVSIVVPTSFHYSAAKFFLNAGKSVLLEKPITETVKQASEIVEIAEKRNLILQVGHLERFNPAFSAVKDEIKNPLFIEAERLSPFNLRGTDVDVILDLMIHDIDIILSLVNAEINEIRAVGVPVVTDKIDIANARIQFKSGCIANIAASRVSKEKVRKIRIFQPDSYISIDYNKKKVNIIKRKLKKGSLPEIVSKLYDIETKDALFEEISSFVKCVRTKAPPVVSGSDGMKALKTALKITKKIQNNPAFKEYGINVV